MRRALVLFAVLLSGRAKSEPPATTTPVETPSISLAQVAGTWDGTVTAAGNDTALVHIAMTATAEASGWTMTVTNLADTTWMAVVPATSVTADGDSVVVEAGPFQSVLRKGQEVSTRTVYRMQGEQLVGDLMATYPATGETVALRSTLTRTAAH